jgi:signal transduction histidine kinase
MWKAPTFRSSPEPLPHAPLQLPTAKPPLPGLLPLLLEIYDTGIGIPVDRVGTIFGKLHQLDPQRERLGLGLGLWIARSTTEVLGHELSVRSTVGWGPRFRLVVPLGMTRKP